MLSLKIYKDDISVYLLQYSSKCNLCTLHNISHSVSVKCTHYQKNTDALVEKFPMGKLVIWIDHSYRSKSVKKLLPLRLFEINRATGGCDVHSWLVGCLVRPLTVEQTVGGRSKRGTDIYGPPGGTVVLGNHNSDAPCRSSVEDSVSLTTTAFVTCMSGCCCLASWIAMASACSWSTSSSPVIMIRFSILVSE